MIRFILVVIFLLFYGIFSIFALPTEWIIGKFNPLAKQRSSQRIVANAFKIILFLSGVRVTKKGLENIPKDEPVLFIGNHRGFFDIVIGYSVLPVLAGYVSKKEFLKVPVLRRWMLNLQNVFLDRSDPREGLKTILKAIENVKAGTSMFIFPEGTRNHGQGLLPFKPGSLKIAEKTGCKIVPVILTNTDDIFENHLPRIKATRTTIEFGKPIEVASLDSEGKKMLLDTCHDTIQKMLEDNGVSC